MYVDGFLLAVSNDKKADYIAHAEKSAVLLKKHGMLSMVECWGDDVPDGTLTSFPMAVKLAEGETVVFSWMTWASKEARDAGWKSIMADPEMKVDMAEMPFDGKRMMYGGFSPVVNV